MRLFHAAAVLFLLLLMWAACAQNADLPPPVPTGDYKITFFLTDTQDAKVPNGQAYFYFTNANSGQVRTSSRISSGVAYTFLDSGEWKGIIEIDDPSTPAYDYVRAFSTSVHSDANISLSLYDVSSTNLRIHDEAGLLVPSVRVTLDCVHAPPSEKDNLPEDAFRTASSPDGTLLLRHMPAGNCYLYASKDNRAGMLSINSTRGEISERTVVLKDKVKENMLSFSS